jgi:hypothetical protein
MSTPTAGPKAAAPRRAPASGNGTTTTGAKTAPEQRATSLQQHLTTLAECDVLTPEGFYTWSEALRALTAGQAFFVHAAAAQFAQAARKGARDNVDGRLTVAQKAKMFVVIRKIARLLDGGVADALLASASQGARAYGLMEDFLEELESMSVSRPHRAARGGFDLYGGK